MSMKVDLRDSLYLFARFGQAPQTVRLNARVFSAERGIVPFQLDISGSIDYELQRGLIALPVGELLSLSVVFAGGTSVDFGIAVEAGISRQDLSSEGQVFPLVSGLIGFARSLCWPASLQEGEDGGLVHLNEASFLPNGLGFKVKSQHYGPSLITGIHCRYTTSAVVGTRRLRFGYPTFLGGNDSWFDFTFPFLPSTTYEIQALHTAQPVSEVIVGGSNYLTFSLPSRWMLEGTTDWQIEDILAGINGDTLTSMRVWFLN